MPKGCFCPRFAGVRKGFFSESRAKVSQRHFLQVKKRPCAMLTNVDPYLPGVVVILGLPFVSWFPAHELDGHAPCVQLRGLAQSFRHSACQRQFCSDKMCPCFSATGPRPPATAAGHQPPASTGHRPPATGLRPPATASGHRPPATGHRPPAKPTAKPKKVYRHAFLASAN